MTSWIFEFRYEGLEDNPVLTKFVTSKSLEELKSKFGGENSYLSEDPRVLLSIWYFDEYTHDYQDLGHEIVDTKAFYLLNDDDIFYELYILNSKVEDFDGDYQNLVEAKNVHNYIDFLTNPTIVDLDKVFCSPPLTNHRCYPRKKWIESQK